MLIPSIDMKLTGQKISALRITRGLSVRELQELLGLATPQAIYKWQRGETLPSLESLAALACILGVRIDEILFVECRAGKKSLCAGRSCPASGECSVPSRGTDNTEGGAYR